MVRLSPHILVALSLLTPPLALAQAKSACEACRPADETQTGGYVEPALPAPSPDPRVDTQGQGHSVKLPTGETVTLHHKKGDGVWLGDVGPTGGAVYVKPGKDKTTLNWKLGF